VIRKILICAALILVGVVVEKSWRHYRDQPAPVVQPDSPMPAPTPTTPQSDVSRVRRVEVMDGNKVAIVLTVENGIPVVIISDRGTARKLDLVSLARRLD